MKKTFFGEKGASCEPDKSLFHILPIPYASENGPCKGMEQGSNAILDASAHIGDLDVKTRRSLTRYGVYTHDAPPPAETARARQERIEASARGLDLFRPRRIPIALGGDASISGALIRAAAQKYDGLSVIQLGAQTALRDEFGPEGKDSYASATARALDVVDEFVCVGTRTLFDEELERVPELAERVVTPDDIENNFVAAVEKILWKTSYLVYLTIDMNVFDPSVAPGVGCPTPGGLTWRQVAQLVEAIVAAKSLAGADVVGTKPLGGANVVTEYAAANLVGAVIGAASRKYGGL